MGMTLTRQLSAEGHDLTLIDSNYNVLFAGMDKYDIMTVQGNCASAAVLEAAGIQDADLLIAATSGDEVNLLCCMTAHAINSKLHTIARVRNPDYSQQVYQMADLFALSLSVNPDQQAAAEIERLIKYPGFLKRDLFAKGRAEIVELRITHDSRLCDCLLRDMNSIVGCRVLVCTVLRDGRAIIPDGQFILRSGDRIFVTASRENLTTLLKNLGIIAKRGKRVLLCGGSRISYYLAKKLLESGMSVSLIELDHDRCLRMSEVLPGVCVIHGDASNQELLEQERLDQYDVLVSLTGLDEINIMISLHANSVGVRQVITKLGHLENSNILRYLPLSSIVNPKALCSASIVRYVRALCNQSGAAVSVHRIADGQVEALEFLVEDTTPHCGVPLRSLHLRKDVLLCCICSGAHTEIPSGESSFYPGDTVVVVNNGTRIFYTLNDIFEDRPYEL